MPENFVVINLKIKRPNLRVFCQKDTNAGANSEDPDQTAPQGAVCSGSALFSQTYWSENLGLLAHLSQRLIGELIVYEGIRRPSVRPSSVVNIFKRHLL